MEKLLLGRLTELLILHEYQSGFGATTQSVTQADLRFSQPTSHKNKKEKHHDNAETSTLNSEDGSQDLSDIDISRLSFSYSTRPSFVQSSNPSQRASTITNTSDGLSAPQNTSSTKKETLNEASHSVKCPKMLKELTRIAFMKLKPFHNQGPEFWRQFEDFLDGSFVETIQKLSKGTQFDMVKFSAFYLSLIWNLKAEIWQKPTPEKKECVDDTDEQDSEENIAELMRQLPVNHHALWHRYLSKDHHRVGSFHLSLSQTSHMPDEQRIHKLNGFLNAWKQLLITISKVSRLHGLSDTFNQTGGSFARSFDPDAFWNAIAQAPRISDLEPKWRDLVDVTVSVIARTFDHILDHPGRRRKLNSIVSKLPINVLIMTLKLLQPLKMLDKMLRVLLWRPKGSKTMLYKLAGILCDMEKTEKQYKLAKSRVSSKRRSDIQAAITSNHSLATGLDSRSSIETLSELLSSRLIKVNETDVQYAHVLLRRREKQDFMDLFGGEGSNETYMPVIRCILVLIGESNKFCDLSLLVSTMFNALKQTMDALKVYDEHHTENTVRLQSEKDLSAKLGAMLGTTPQYDYDPYDDTESNLSDHEDIMNKFTSAMKTEDVVEPHQTEMNENTEDGFTNSYQQMVNEMRSRQQGASAQVHATVIGDIEAIWYQFFDRLYPMLHDFAKKQSLPNNGATLNENNYKEEESTKAFIQDLTNQAQQYQSLIESQAREYLAWINTDAPSLTTRILTRLRDEEQRQLWQEVKVMAFMCAEGIPEKEWPDLPMIHERAFTLFLEEIQADVEYVKNRLSVH